jgi:hypothetical protein
VRVVVRALATATVEEEWTFDVPDVHLQAIRSDPDMIWDLFHEDAAYCVDVENVAVFDERDRTTEKVEVMDA